ncbi:MAG: alpha-L-rhamnosidase C-terminal domain-containing protein [Bacteroidota bacterium]|nr:alpha-L-rhamnosidase C-terminal domain-containing protein [Bacteroidota bacterium]
MKKHFLILSIICWFLTGNSYGQITDTLRTNRLWNAQWIGFNRAFDRGTSYGVYYFRKSIQLKDKPSKFIIHVSADNHYKLYVNGKLASIGPSRGDLHYWHYETVDISGLLAAGKNTVVAMVWNEAEYRPEYQVSLRTSFIIQGNTSVEEILNTDNTWKCVEDKAFSPIFGYFASINGQFVDMNKTVSNWNSSEVDENSWPNAVNLWGGQPKGLSDGFGYMLVPSPLPPMEMTYQPITVVRKVQGMDSFSALKLPLTISANKKVVILLDQTHETNAYPTITFSGGKGAGLSLGYAEALYEKGSNFKRKGNRNEVEGMEFRGLKDSITSNGQPGQSYTSFNFRTFRYVQLLVQTSNEPLVIDSLYGTFTAYPFKAEAAFNSDNNEIPEILNTGWRTARLNAYDNYFTGQYYERLQYIGDARIQAMISYFYSSDNRLTRNALEQIDESRLPEGVTLSRYPTQSTQIIPTFSLLYIGMLHDYWMYRNDTSFIKDKLTSVRAILGFFSKYQQADGSLHNTPYWNFVDWADAKGWDFGSPPKSADGESALIDMHLLWGYEWAAEMETQSGLSVYADLYRKKADQLKQTIRKKYWDEAKGLYADTRERTTFSQHCNALALLTGVVSDENKLAFSKRLINDSSLTKCSMYFSYYLHQALIKGGLGDDYMNWLNPWRESLKIGLTTWAEEPNLNTTRSDCHAWASGPNVELFRTVLGIDSYSPGFSKIKIEPHLGKLTKISGEIPHPNGKISVSYVLKHNKWNINISIPQNTTGIFIWKGITYKLKGENNLLVM